MGAAEPSSLLKIFKPVFASTTLWCTCMAEPGSPAMGLAMKVAYISCFKAASRRVRLKKKTLSARPSGSPCRKLISICPAPISWISVSTSRFINSQ
ncbi:hypothetical protein D3C72_2002280 [compost metagenome]